MKQFELDLDSAAVQTLQTSGYVWSDLYVGFESARRRGESLADYRKRYPSVITLEELFDHGLTVGIKTSQRLCGLNWLRDRIARGCESGVRDDSATA
jgi:hypothetical protein